MFDLKTFLIGGPNVNLQIGFLHGKGIDIVFKIKKSNYPGGLGLPRYRTYFPFPALVYSKFESNIVWISVRVDSFGYATPVCFLLEFRGSFGYSEKRHFRHAPAPR